MGRASPHPDRVSPSHSSHPLHLLTPIASPIATALTLGRASPHWLDSCTHQAELNIMLRSFWETADPTFSHISYKGYLGSEDTLKNKWQREWLHHYNGTLRGATVVDYGIARYIGIDISNRQVANARQRLAGYNARFERVDALSASIVSNETPTLVVSQAVIQHFESVKYFKAQTPATHTATHGIWSDALVVG